MHQTSTAHARAHVDFARDKLVNWVYGRKPPGDRWTARISQLDVALGIDTYYALLNMWRALERVRGQGWFESRPYDDQIIRMSASNPLKAIVVNVVALLYGHDGKFRELEASMKKILEQCDDHEGDCCPGLQMVVLCFTSYSLSWQGGYNESPDVNHRQSELTGSELELQLPNERRWCIPNFYDLQYGRALCENSQARP